MHKFATYSQTHTLFDTDEMLHRLKLRKDCSLHAHKSSRLQYSHNSHVWLEQSDLHSHAKVTFAFIMDFCLFHYFIGKLRLLSSLHRYID